MHDEKIYFGINSIKMKNTSILGCGWLGKPLALSLINKGFIVKGSTTSLDKLPILKDTGISPFLIDIDNLDNNLKEEFNNNSDENIQKFLTSEILIVAITSKNVAGFQNFIQQIEKSSIQKVIFISSTSVYPSLNKSMDEKEQTLNSPLVEIENSFKENNHFDTTILRFAGLFGQERQAGNWFQNKKIPYPKGFVNMIHQQDCINIITEIIVQNAWNETFNACSNHHPTREEYYINARKTMQKESPIFDDSLPLKYKIINSKKLQNHLKYTFIYDDLLA